MAIRVVIADDEKYVLLVLKNALQSIRYPIEIVGEAQDGVEAYCLCCDRKPDLLITDICMPLKDGLDLLAKIRSTIPDLPVIILSGYDNFSYAQKAIHYGVEEYLLKPIDEAKLEQAIGNVIQRGQDALIREKLEVRNGILRQCLKKSSTNGAADSGQLEISQTEQAFLEGLPGCTLYMLWLRVQKDVQPRQWHSWFLGQNVYCWDLNEDIGRLTVLGKDITPEALLQAADDIWGVDSYLCRTQRISGDAAKTRTSLQNATEELLSFDLQLGRMIRTFHNYFWQNTPQAGKKATKNAASADIEQINRQYFDRVTIAIEFGKRDYLKSLLQSYWAELLEIYCKQAPGDIKRNVLAFMQHQASALQLPKPQVEESLQTLGSLPLLLSADEVLEKLLACGTTMIELAKVESPDRRSRDTREIIERYLRENYRQDITLDQLANYLHFNSSYTSNLFKRLFGKPFVSYLTALRMEAAKKLLDSGKFKTYEIAEQVGYQDEKYFLKMFKKVTGCTPREYRRKGNGPDGAAADGSQNPEQHTSEQSKEEDAGG